MSQGSPSCHQGRSVTVIEIEKKAKVPSGIPAEVGKRQVGWNLRLRAGAPSRPDPPGGLGRRDATAEFVGWRAGTPSCPAARISATSPSQRFSPVFPAQLSEDCKNCPHLCSPQLTPSPGKTAIHAPPLRASSRARRREPVRVQGRGNCFFAGSWLPRLPGRCPGCRVSLWCQPSWLRVKSLAAQAVSLLHLEISAARVGFLSGGVQGFDFHPVQARLQLVQRNLERHRDDRIPGTDQLPDIA